MTEWIARRQDDAQRLLQEYFPPGAVKRAVGRLLPANWGDGERHGMRLLGGHTAVVRETKGRWLQRAVNQTFLSGALEEIARTRPGATRLAEFACEMIYLDKLRGRHSRPPGRRRVGIRVCVRGTNVKTWERDETLRDTYRSLQMIVEQQLPGFEIVAPPRRRRGFQPAPARAVGRNVLRNYAPQSAAAQPPFRYVGGDRYLVFVQRHGTRRRPRSVTIARSEAKIVGMQG